MAVVSSLIYVAICVGATVFVTMITDTNPLVAFFALVMGVLLVIGVAVTAASDGETRVTHTSAEPINGIFVNTQSREEIKELGQPEQSRAITVIRY
jgi:hypothetical protein